MREMRRIHDESVKELDAYYRGKNDALSEFQERLSLKDKEKQEGATTRFEELMKEQESTIPGYENGNLAEINHP